MEANRSQGKAVKAEGTEVKEQGIAVNRSQGKAVSRGQGKAVNGGQGKAVKGEETEV